MQTRHLQNIHIMYIIIEHKNGFRYLSILVLKTYKFSKDIVKIFKMIKAKQNQNYWKNITKLLKIGKIKNLIQKLQVNC